eukprot:6191266-Pleurochrysis_carterae.AAC.1
MDEHGARARCCLSCGRLCPAAAALRAAAATALRAAAATALRAAAAVSAARGACRSAVPLDATDLPLVQQLERRRTAQRGQPVARPAARERVEPQVEHGQLTQPIQPIQLRKLGQVVVVENQTLKLLQSLLMRAEEMLQLLAETNSS